jgi:hypothetical protein
VAETKVVSEGGAPAGGGAGDSGAAFESHRNVKFLFTSFVTLMVMGMPTLVGALGV